MKNNLLAKSLMTLLGALLLVATLQVFEVGTKVEQIQPEPFDASTLPALEQEKGQGDSQVQINSPQTMEQIVAAPLFNSSREPYIPPPPPEEQVEPEPEVKASPLNVKITSIIITGEKQYVMLQDNVSNQRLTLSKGMPLEGEQGLWSVAKIEPRKVTFNADGEEPVELELEVFSKMVSRPPTNRGQTNPKKGGKKPPVRGNKQAAIQQARTAAQRKNDAAKIRQKIAERRAQMRQEAANRKKK